MFCTSCGVAMPADARFCPKCGKAATAPAPAAASPPVPAAPKPAGGQALDLTQPKSQVELIFALNAVVLVIFGLIGLSNSGAGSSMLFFALADIGIAINCGWGAWLTRQGRYREARNSASASGLILVVFGFIAVALAGSAGGFSLLICLLLAATLGYAYLQLGKLMAA